LNAHRRSRVGGPSCSAENPATAKFCLECSKPLVSAIAEKQRSAQSANWTVQVGDRPTENTLEGERKTVTALFADIKGSTELMRDLDPEEARAIVDPVLQLMMAAVHRYGGNVASTQRSATRCRTCLGCWGFRARPTRSPRWTRKSGADARSKQSGGSSWVKA
jgi:hypothetical protein